MVMITSKGLEVFSGTFWDFHNEPTHFHTCLQDRRNSLKREIAEALIKIHFLK